uniref:Death domain-containing protein n=2 Tax=Amphimedon queenslandica TaxID=400682 RepID=A0A1X7UDQ4_AMPQE
MWGGFQPDLPGVHNNEEKKSFCSVVEVCHLPTGMWVQKPTTGDPPLGVGGYAAAVIRNEIFFFGGYCGHDECFHNSLYSFNVDTFNWKELSPTTSHHGPMMKFTSSMIAIKVNSEDYLVVIGGRGPSSNNTPPQPGAQYSNGRCNEVHMYRLKTGEWTSPTVTGDRPPPINDFPLTSITNTTAILFGGSIGHNSYSNDVYVFEFTDTSVKCKKFPNPGGSVQWPKERECHSSVLINCSSGPHLLVVGGVAGTPTIDCWLLNINKMEWKELTNIPDSVTYRWYHSLSVWNETQTTHWITEFGGERGVSKISDTRFIEIITSTGDIVVQSVLDINEYQKRRIQDAVGKWMEEGSVDLTVTRVNMLGAPGAGKTCSQLLLLNEAPPTNNTSTPIACPAVRATRVAVCDKTIWNRKEYVTEIPQSTSGYHKFRDAMSLKITITSKHTLHLINRYTHIEVYFTGPTQHCPLVCKLLTTAIDNSSDAMHLKHNYVNAFACPSKRSSCYCIVRPREDGNIVNCTVCPVSATISSDHWYWFESGPDEGNNGTQNLLDKRPLKSDLLRLFKDSAVHSKIIGTALDVKVDDLVALPQYTSDNLILVFQRWIDSDKDVTWRKALQVCKDYPDELGRAKSDVEKFLSSSFHPAKSSSLTHLKVAPKSFALIFIASLILLLCAIVISFFIRID